MTLYSAVLFVGVLVGVGISAAASSIADSVDNKQSSQFMIAGGHDDAGNPRALVVNPDGSVNCNLMLRDTLFPEDLNEDQ